MILFISFGLAYIGEAMSSSDARLTRFGTVVAGSGGLRETTKLKEDILINLCPWTL